MGIHEVKPGFGLFVLNFTMFLTKYFVAGLLLPHKSSIHFIESHLFLTLGELIMNINQHLGKYIKIIHFVVCCFEDFVL